MASPFSFDIEKISLAKALWFDAVFHLRTLAAVRKISYWIFWGFLLSFVYGFLTENFAVSTQRTLLGAALVLFAYTATLFLLGFFGNYLKSSQSSKATLNFAELLSFEIAKATKHALKFAKQRKHPELTSSLLFFFLLKENPSLKFIFYRALLDEKELKTKLSQTFHTVPRPAEKQALQYSADFQATLLRASEIVQKNNREQMELPDVLAGLAAFNPVFKDMLVAHDLTEKDIYDLSSWHQTIGRELQESKKFWLLKNLKKRGSIGKQWAAGYTITLDRFSSDFSDEVARMNFPKAQGHDSEKEALQRVLSRPQNNNALLVGEPGSGRKRLVWDFASKSVLGEHKNPRLNYQRVVQLDLPVLLASVESREQVEAVLNQIFQEVIKAGNIILIIDEFHNFVGGAQSNETAASMNIAGVLSPYLRSPQLPIIALTTYAGLHRYIDQNPSLLAFFEKIEVREISKDETLEVLQEIVPALEAEYRRFISYHALKAVLLYGEKYIQAVPFPKKAIDVLQEAVVALAQSDEKLLLPRHVARLIAEKTEIPVGEIESEEREVLLNLEDLIHRRIIDQEEAVKEIASALRRARVDISIRSGPMGAFLFLGPTGVGKTESAKALAAIYFGSESRMIRLDMSEFQNLSDIPRLLGDLTQEGLLTTPIRENPFALLLLDELEKAHPNIINLFLQVLDEGHITDGLGRKVDFRHTMIIATSNAGYQLILEALRQKKDFSQLKQEMLDYLFGEGRFRPEFLNRFDAVVLFKPLQKEHLLKIAELMLSKLQKNLELKGIELVITQPLKEKIVELGYDPTFGARNMRRVVQDRVENALAKALLLGALQKGERITVDSTTFEVQKL